MAITARQRRLCAIALFIAASSAYAQSSGQTGSGQASIAQASIAPAPAFTAEQLVAPPTRNWVTNGGNSWNQRYSPLTEINRFNVSLDGNLEPVQSQQSAAPGATPLVAPAGQERVADMDNGSTIWDNACAACHGELGQGGHGGGSDIRATPLSLSQIMQVVNAGRKTMPAFAGFSEQELLDISTYVKNSL